MGLALLFVLQMFLMRRRHSIQESIVFVRTIDDNLDAKEISKSDLETGTIDLWKCCSCDVWCYYIREFVFVFLQ